MKENEGKLRNGGGFRKALDRVGTTYLKLLMMKSKLLKLTSVLSAVAFMAVTLFTTPAQAEIVSTNDVVVDATYDDAALDAAIDKHVLVYQCFVFVCTIDEAAN